MLKGRTVPSNQSVLYAREERSAFSKRNHNLTNIGPLNVGLGINKMIVPVYLVTGTGNACAWQNRAMVDVLGNLNELLNAADGNDGAFKPMGSVECNS